MSVVLLDTNVLIELQDTGRELSERGAQALRRASGIHEFCIHPRQFEDIERDGDEARKRLLLSRVRQYRVLEQVPTLTCEEFEKRGWQCSNINDEIDNCLLLCIDRPVVSFLVTNDKGLLRKAQKAGLSDRVMDLDAFALFCDTDDHSPDTTLVNNEPCYAIDVRDSFFDSLRKTYSSYNEWFDKCSREGRHCWTVRTENQLGAICVYKTESKESINDQGFMAPLRTLKLCTFKVAPVLQGTKVGEKLLFHAFQYCKCNECNYLYVTVQSSLQPHLVELFQAFGFEENGTKGADVVFGKYTKPQSEEDWKLPKETFYWRFFPSVKTGPEVAKYLVPIEPRWHERLFPDLSDFSSTLLGGLPEMYSSESNTIRKAYLCKAPINSIERGDLLFFYRSKDRQAIEALGVVDACYRKTDASEIYDLTKRRTVYSSSEITNIVQQSRRGVLVILFDYIGGLSDPVSLAKMRQCGLEYSQTIKRIDDSHFTALFGGKI